MVCFPRTETTKREWVSCTCQFHSILLCEMYRVGTRLIYLLDTVPLKMLKSTYSPTHVSYVSITQIDNFSLWLVSVMITVSLVWNSTHLLQSNVKGEKKEVTLAFWNKVLKNSLKNYYLIESKTKRDGIMLSIRSVFIFSWTVENMPNY